MKFCNQFIVKIDKTEECADWLELLTACKMLNGVALKLYIYLNSFHCGQEVKLSPKSFCEETGVSLTSEKNAFKELLLAGILKQETMEYYVFKPIKID